MHRVNLKNEILVIVTILFVIFSVVGYLIWNSSENKREAEVVLNIPEYTTDPSVEINNNIPFFTEDDYSIESYEIYSELDYLGRCGEAKANLCKDLMPTEERGYIGNIKPTGWKQAKYDGVVESNPPYLYNRCHLIAYCLAGENANEKNLITGTRYMNIEGMLPYEEEVVKYLDKSNNHVLYRVTPIFTSNNLLADGVLMEAFSIEDNGEGISFCVFCYNVQPGVEIDYKSGENHVVQ